MFNKVLKKSRNLLANVTIGVQGRAGPRGARRPEPSRILDLTGLEDRLLFSAAPITPDMLDGDAAAGIGQEPAVAPDGDGALVAAGAPENQGADQSAPTSEGQPETTPQEISGAIPEEDGVEQLEAGLDAATAGSHDSVLPWNEAADTGPTSEVETASLEVRRELVFVDTAAQDYQQLLADVEANGGEGRQLEVVLLDAGRDGVEQITEVLADYHDLDAVHVVSHGVDGAVQLGNTWLQLGNVNAYASQIATWSDALANEADLLFYGCDLAAGEDGRTLLEGVGILTGADVAASTDDTGSSLLGGNWDLEYASGRIESTVVFTADVQQDWSYLLAAPAASDDPADFNATLTALSPVGYWRLGESTGSTAADEMLVNDGTYHGPTLSQAGALDGDANTAANFDGIGDYVEIAHDSSYLADNGTLQLWFNTNDITSGHLFSKDASGFATGGNLSAFLNASGHLQVRLQSASASYYVESTAGQPIVAGQWHHMAFTFGSQGMKLYVDGQLAGTNAYTGGLGTTSGGTGNFEPIAIGASTQTSGSGIVTPLEDFFSGSIDEVAIFDSALSGEEIQDLYAAALQNYTVGEDTTLNVTAAAGVLANDFDSDGDPLTATGLDTAGTAGLVTLNLDGSFSYDPNGQFESLAAGAQATDTFTYTASDGTLTSNIATVTITIAGVNDAPVISLPGSAVSYTENGAATVIDATATVSDVDSADFDTGTLTIDFTAGDTANDRLAVRNEGTGAGQIGVSGSDVTYEGTTIGTVVGGAIGPTPLVIALNANATPAAAQALMRNITYENVSDNPSTAARTVRFVLTDGDGGTSNVATQTVNVTAVNDAPQLDLDADDSSGQTGSDFSTTFTEDGGPVPIVDADAFLADSDNSNLQSVTVTLSGVPDGSAESMTANTAGTNIVANYNITAGVLTLTGNDTVAAYQQVLRTVQYNNTSDNPDVTNRTITFVANDGLADSNIGTTTLNVVAVNDAPSMDLDADDSSGQPGANFAATWNEGSGPVALADSDATLADVDSPNLQSLVVRIVNLLDGSAESLSADTAGTSIAASYNSVNGTLTLSGSDSLAHYRSVLQTVSYDNTSDAPNATARFITFVANDGTTVSNTAFTTLTIVPTNDAPVAGADSVSTSEDTPVVISASSLLANDTDADLDTLSITGFTQPTSGTVVDNGDGTFTYSPAADFNGADSFTYTVSDGNGGTDTATVSITVTPVNDAPVAAADSVSTSEDTPLVISAASLLANDTDVDLDTLSITGFTQPTSGTVVDNGDGTFTYSPAANFNGADSFTYTVTDGNGGTDTATVNITVTPVNDAPVAAADSVTTSEDTPLVISAASLLANDTDVDLDTLSITGFTQPTSGTVVDNGDGTFTYFPAANFNGADSFTYTVSDGNGGTDAATVSITVTPVNDAPVAAADSVTTSEDTPLVISAASLLANDTDVELDTLSITGFTQPSSGTVVDNGDGTFTYSPAADFNGADNFTYTVTDGNGGTDTATVNITVTPINDAPVAAADSVTTSEDTPLVISAASLLANDTDVDLDTLSVAGFTQPANGTVVDNGDGTFTYSPAADFNGADSFSYTVTDGNGGTDTATVNITVTPVNDAPVAAADSVTTSEDTPLVISAASLLANDTDVELDTLSIAGFTQPANGTVVDNGDGTFTYSPVADFNGADSFTYTVSDGNGGTDTATVSITVTPVNDAPVAANDSVTTSEDTPLVITAASLLANDTDVELDTLSVTGFTQPTSGTVVDNGDGTFTYSPAANFNGADSFTYTVSDGNGGTDTATVSITVTPVNDAPVAAADTVTTSEDTPLVISAASLLANDTDVDLDTLAITGFTQPTSGTVVDNGDGTFTYSPAADFNGADSFSYTVSDGNGGTDTATVSITVTAVNDAPVAAADSVSTSEDTPLVISAASLLANDTDVDLDTLSVTGFTQPTSGTVVDNGDGTFTYSPAANFNGADSFTYTVSDGNGGTDTATVDITVTPVNDAPVAAADSVTTSEDTPLVISAASLLANDTDVDLDTLSIASFTQPTSGAVVDNGDGTFTYTPAASFNGADSFTYTVTDGNGATDTATVNVTVTPVNDAPVAAADSVSTNEDTPLTITAASLLANDTDVDLDTLSITGFTQPANGTVVDNGDGTFTYSPAANFNGADSFTYTVSDGNGGTDTATVSVTVTPVNDAPVAAADSVSTSEDTPLLISVASLLANDTDVELDTLSVTGFTQPTSGTVVDNGDGTFTYTPNANFNGSDSFTYTVSDGNGGTDTAAVSITVAPVNDAPVAAADTVTTSEDTPLVISAASLLANDTDVDLDTLSIASFTQPANGTVVDNGDGTFTYSPAANFNGADSFTYTVSDGNGGTDTATVSTTVTPVNDAPVAAADSVTTSEDTPLVITAASLLANDTDVELDALSITGFTQPANGTAVDNGDGTFTYSPAANFSGADSFAYTVSDGNGGTDIAVVNITVAPVNDAPLAAADSVSTSEDTPLVISAASLLANDTDVDLDTLSIASFTQPTSGTVVDNGDGTFTYSPAANFNGADSFSYTVTDGNGGTDTATVSITVTPVNDAPVAAADSVTTSEDTPLVITAASLLANDTDVELDTLSIASFTQPANGTVADNGDGTFTYSPAADFNGADSFTYTVSDGNGGTDTATVSITVTPVNDAPVAANDSVTTSEDTPLVITAASLLANDTDVDLDTLSIASFTQPTSGTVVDNGDGTFTYSPAADFNGADSFTYTVTDGNGGTDTATVNITVTPVNDAPVAANDSVTTSEDTPLVISAASLLANDTDVDLDTLSIAGFTQPTSGTVVDNGDGTFTYSPAADFNGADSFSYTVSDGNGGTDAATVSITVTPVNDAPVAAADSVTTSEDTPLVISAASLLANDTDVELDTLSIAGFTQPTSGTVVDNGDGTFTYAPNTNFNGSDSFTYTVSDGNGGTDTATVNITVAPVNDAPVAAADSVTTGEDTPLVITAASLLANDTDVDLDTLSITGFTQPANGTVADNGDGTFTYSPAADFNGADTFAYTVSDGNGGTDIAVVNITVAPVNDAPVAAADSVSTNEDTPLVISAASLLANDTDVELDTLSIASFTQPTSGTVVDNGDGTFTYTPNTNFNGSDSFTYTVSDGNGATDTATVNITVTPVNDAPVAAADSVSTSEDTPLVISAASLLANDTDVDPDTLSIASFTQPTSGTVVDNGDGTFTYTPNATYNGPDGFTYTVADGNGGTDTASVNITVEPRNDPPVASDDSLSTSEDTPLVITAASLLANDTDVDLDTLSIASFTQPTSGTVVDNGDGTFTYTPAANFNGADGFTYTVADGHGGTDTAAVNITVTSINDAPVAAADSVSTSEDTPLVISAASLLANDTDADLDPLTIASFTQPANGTLVDNGDGTFTYAPNVGFAGADHFSYVTHDGNGGGTMAVVTVDVVQDGLPPSDPEREHDDTPSDGEEQPAEAEEPVEGTADKTAVEYRPAVRAESPQTVRLRPFRSHQVRGTFSTADVDTGNPVPRQLEEVSSTDDPDIVTSPTWPIRSTSSSHQSGRGRPGPLESLARQVADFDFPQLWYQLDVLGDDLQHDARLRSLVTVGVVGITTVATASYTIWAMRSGYFAMTALASIPTWRSLDVVPVLDFQDRKRKQKTKDRTTRNSPKFWAAELQNQ